jgi:Flp pilus assembly CpaE family ATPase
VDACEAGDHVDTDKLQSCMTPHASGLSLLAEPAHPASSDDVSAHHVHSVLQQLTGIYPM